MKRLFDLTLALVVAIPAAPLMLVITLAVKFSSRGPAWYWSQRVGRDNRLFWMPKFRSMRIDTPEVATHLLQDTRQWITPVGRLLRKSSLDELPQLWCILKGDMSFVGPRPALHNQYDLIEMRTRVNVHQLTPGLTGWAQVNGRDELSLEDKVQYDAAYRKQQSLGFDLKILWRTAFRVLKTEGVTQADEQHKSRPKQKRAA